MVNTKIAQSSNGSNLYFITGIIMIAASPVIAYIVDFIGESTCVKNSLDRCDLSSSLMTSLLSFVVPALLAIAGLMVTIYGIYKSKKKIKPSSKSN
jgi:hypothetical protein